MKKLLISLVLFFASVNVYSQNEINSLSYAAGITCYSMPKNSLPIDILIDIESYEKALKIFEEYEFNLSKTTEIEEKLKEIKSGKSETAIELATLMVKKFGDRVKEFKSEYVAGGYSDLLGFSLRMNIAYAKHLLEGGTFDDKDPIKLEKKYYLSNRLKEYVPVKHFYGPTINGVEIHKSKDFEKVFSENLIFENSYWIEFGMTSYCFEIFFDVIVDKNGYITYAYADSPEEILNILVVNAINKLDRFEPAKLKGKPVAVRSSKSVMPDQGKIFLLFFPPTLY